MKKRLIKKQAKRYLDGRGIMTKYVLGEDCYKSGSVWKTVLVVRNPIRREIYRQAYRLGWDGCHWDDPMILSITEEEPI